MRSLSAGLALVLSLTTAVAAQDGARTIDPGMSKADVVARLGAPAAERRAGDFTYLFYHNGCERSCGMSDVVVLEGDAVVDAIFRSPGRSYSGESSSPRSAQPVKNVDGSAAPAPRPRRQAVPAAEAEGRMQGRSRGALIEGRAPADRPAADAGAARVGGIRVAPASANPPTDGAAPATPASPNPARAEALRRAPHDSAVRTPQAPALGAPVPRDSSYVPGIARQGRPVPFQGARPGPGDSIRLDSARRARARADSAARARGDTSRPATN